MPCAGGSPTSCATISATTRSRCPRPASNGRCAGRSTSRRCAGTTYAYAPLGRRLRGEILSAGEQGVTVAAADGAETEIPYQEIVRANLIPSDVKGSVT